MGISTLFRYELEERLPIMLGFFVPLTLFATIILAEVFSSRPQSIAEGLALCIGAGIAVYAVIVSCLMLRRFRYHVRICGCVAKFIDEDVVVDMIRRLFRSAKIVNQRREWSEYEVELKIRRGTKTLTLRIAAKRIPYPWLNTIKEELCLSISTYFTAGEVIHGSKSFKELLRIVRVLGKLLGITGWSALIALKKSIVPSILWLRPACRVEERLLHKLRTYVRKKLGIDIRGTVIDTDIYLGGGEALVRIDVVNARISLESSLNGSRDGIVNVDTKLKVDVEEHRDLWTTSLVLARRLKTAFAIAKQYLRLLIIAAMVPQILCM